MYKNENFYYSPCKIYFLPSHQHQLYFFLNVWYLIALQEFSSFRLSFFLFPTTLLGGFFQLHQGFLGIAHLPSQKLHLHYDQVDVSQRWRYHLHHLAIEQLNFQEEDYYVVITRNIKWKKFVQWFTRYMKSHLCCALICFVNEDFWHAFNGHRERDDCMICSVYYHCAVCIC